MNHVSLFSGIGGIDIAAHWAGFKTVAFVERDKFCQKVLTKNWPGVPIHDDVKTFNRSCVSEPVGIISGGFPCQPYSTAGERLGDMDDRSLWPEYLRIVQEFRPAWVVGENVAGIIDLALDNVLASLEGIGYSARAFDIPASAIGADHERRRIFIIANSERQRQQGQGERLHAEYKAPDINRETSRAVNAVSRKAVPYVCTAHDGIPGSLDELTAYGNAVVPQQIYPIFKAIADIERGI